MGIVAWLARAELEQQRLALVAAADALGKSADAMVTLREAHAAQLRKLVRGQTTPILPAWTHLIHAEADGRLDSATITVPPWTEGYLVGVIVWGAGASGHWNVRTSGGSALLEDQPVPDGCDAAYTLRAYPLLRAPSTIVVEGTWSLEPGGFVHAAAVLLPTADSIHRPNNAMDLADFPNPQVLELIEAATLVNDAVSTTISPRLRNALVPFRPLIEIREARQRRARIEAEVERRMAEGGAEADAAPPTP